MGGTKIIVLQLREIIKTFVFALIGLALIIALIFLFLPKDKNGEPNARARAYVPGTYTSQILLNKEPVNVEVVVNDTEILSIELKNMAEVQEVFYPLMQPAMTQLAEAIIDNQSLDIQISSEYAVTGQVLLNAVRDALKTAEAPTT